MLLGIYIEVKRDLECVEVVPLVYTQKMMNQAFKTIVQAVRRSRLPIVQQAVGWASNPPD